MITAILESIMRMAMERQAKDFDSILMDVIILWKNATKFWYLFINLEKYLIGATEESLEEGENFELLTHLILCKFFITNSRSIFDLLGDPWPSNG
jgi:hypothetical protein